MKRKSNFCNISPGPGKVVPYLIKGEVVFYVSTSETGQFSFYPLITVSNNSRRDITRILFGLGFFYIS